MHKIKNIWIVFTVQSYYLKEGTEGKLDKDLWNAMLKYY